MRSIFCCVFTRRLIAAAPFTISRFTNQQFERLQNSLPRPFGMWNCKHSMFPVLMSAPPLHSEEEIEEYRRNSAEQITIDGKTKSRYEWTQEQRRIETAIRQQKDIANLARAAGDMQQARKASASIEKLYERYDRISDAAGLDKQYSRGYVRGYRETRVAGTAEQLKKTVESGIILENILIPKSLGAKGINYDILSPDGERYYRYVEGTYVQKVKAFAGYGTKTPLHDGVAVGLTKEFGGDPAKWRHVKGEGMVDDDGEAVRAEIHWFQEESVGQVKHMIKKWLE